MATGFGLMPDAKGNGTTDQDLQLIIGATYRYEGIISGVAVAQMSKMAYQVMEGAVILNWGTNQKVVVPVTRQEITVDPNPGTTARRDKVYVQQHTVAADGDNLVVVKVTTGSLPPRSLLLADYEVPAGAKDTRGAIDRANRIYTRPVGGQYGILHKTVDKDTSWHDTPGIIKRGVGRIGVLPTERDVMFHMNSCLTTQDALGTVQYKFYVDGALVATCERDVTWNYTNHYFAFPLVLDAKSHDFYYTVEGRPQTLGDNQFRVVHGGPNSNTGDVFWVQDNGVATL